MGKITNVGRGTGRFGEGAIVDGVACKPDGSDTDYALIVTGSMFIDAEGGNKGLTIFKEESDSAFIRFINSDDPSSWYAYIAMDVNENLYIFPGRSQDFHLHTRTGVGSDPLKFPFRIYDNGKAKFEHGQTNSSAAVSDLPSDVVFFVSGSGSGTEGISVFGGNVITSGSLNADGNIITSDSVYTDKIRRASDSSTTTKILLNDEVIKLHAGHSSNQTCTVDAAGLKINNGTLAIGAMTVGVRDVNSTSSVLATDYVLRCIQNSPITITLPAKSAHSGRVLVFKDVLGNAGSNNITIDGDSSDTIDGAATYVINSNKEAITLICDGINGWMITSKV